MKAPPSLDMERALLWVAILAPLFFGGVSMLLGADANFDLRNYHLYNAYAFLGRRRHLDLAPAGMQSYFNPLLDLFYYGMSTHFPARLTGFVMGCVQGVNAVLLLGITRRALPGMPASDRSYLPFYLAVAGCLTANFITGLGNTMGDVTTALFPLGALLIVLSRWDVLLREPGRSGWTALLAGLVCGLGVGLKLTNAVYAIGLCAGFLCLPLAWPARLRLGFLFGIGALLGFALTGGFWFVAMWHDYGNPLYPQFSAIFPSPLTRPLNVGDTRWLPKSLLQMLLWPFLFTLDSRHVSELRVLQVIWALLYTLFLLWGGQFLYRKLRGGAAPQLEARHAYLLTYIAVAFVLWMKLFGVYRYLVAIELVAPLAVFLLLVHMLGYPRGRRVAIWALGGAACIVLVGATRSWGHEPWADPLLRADTPALAAPAETTVFTVGEDDGGPYAWLTMFFPASVAFAGVHTSFPASRAYTEHVHQMVQRRGGPVYAIIAAYANPPADDAKRADTAASLARVNAWAERLGFGESGSGCLLLRWVGEKLSLDARVQQTLLDQGQARCELVLTTRSEAEVAGLNRAFISEYARTLAQYGFELDPASCAVYAGYIGEGSYPYQWCRVTDTDTPPARR